MSNLDRPTAFFVASEEDISKNKEYPSHIVLTCPICNIDMKEVTMMSCNKENCPCFNQVKY